LIYSAQFVLYHIIARQTLEAYPGLALPYKQDTPDIN